MDHLAPDGKQFLSSWRNGTARRPRQPATPEGAESGRNLTGQAGLNELEPLPSASPKSLTAEDLRRALRRNGLIRGLIRLSVRLSRPGNGRSKTCPSG